MKHKFSGTGVAIVTPFRKDGSVDFNALIEAGIFEFLRRVVVTDMRPDVFRKILQTKKEEINSWVINKLTPSLEDIEKEAPPLLSMPYIDEVVILSTCNRTEFYFYSETK
jgi:competence protein ComGF